MGWAPVITSLSFFCVSFFAGKWKGKSAARGMGHGQEGHHSAQSAIQAPTPVQDRNPARNPAPLEPGFEVPKTRFWQNPVVQIKPGFFQNPGFSRV